MINCELSTVSRIQKHLAGCCTSVSFHSPLYTETITFAVLPLGGFSQYKHIHFAVVLAWEEIFYYSLIAELFNL